MPNQQTAVLFAPGRPTPSPPPPAPEPAAPPRVGDYQLLHEVGRGGMGVVYEAFDPRLRRRAAVKMPRPDLPASLLPRFQTEAEAMAQLAHPHIVAIFDVGQAHGRPFVACEFLPGGSLLDRTGNKPLPPRAAAGYAHTLAGAVAHAHRHGVVHRDLKPANVLFAADGVAKLTDFGAARLDSPDAAGSAVTRFGEVVGTPQYMAPEQARGGPDAGSPAVDVYALGAVLYQLLTGRPPHDGPDAVGVLAAVLNDDPVPPRRLVPGVPRDLETVCLKALEKQPARRYPSADALHADLGRFVRGEPVAARPTGLVARTARKARRRPLVAGLVLGLLLVAAAGAAGVGWQWRRAVAARDAAQVARADAEHERDRAELSQYAGRVTTAARQIEAGDARADRLLLGDDLTPRQAAARGWEWHHLRRLAAPYLWRAALADAGPLWGHAAAASPDGSRVAVAAGDPYRDNLYWDRNQPSRLFVFDAATGRPVRTAAFLPERAEQVVWVDDRRVAACGLSGSVAVVDVVSGARWAPPTPLLFAENYPAKTRLSPCGRWAVRGSGRGELAVFDLRPAEPTVRPLTPARGRPASPAAVTADGLLAVRLGPFTGAADLLLVDLVGGGVRAVVPDVGEGAVFSPDGRRVAARVGVFGRTGLGVWDTATGRPVWVRPVPLAHPNRGQVYGFTPDGGSLIESHDGDRRVRVWDAAAGQVRFDLAGYTGGVLAVAVGPDGRQAATASTDGSVRVWSLRDGAEVAALRGHANGVRALAFGPHADRLFTGGMDGTLAAWDLTRERPDGTRLPPLHPADPDPPGVPWNHGAAHLGGLWVDAAGTGWHLDTARRRLVGFDPATFTPTHAVTPAGLHTRATTHLTDFALSADGRFLLGPTGGDRTRPAVWATADGTEVGGPPPVPDLVVQASALSADGGRAAVAGHPPGQPAVGGLTVWEPATGRVLHQSGGGERWRSLLFLPDGRLVCGRSDADAPGGIDLLDPAAGTRRHLPAPRPTGLFHLAASADGRRVAGVCNRRPDGPGNAVFLWDVAGGELLWHAPDLGPTAGLAFHPAGNQLAAVRHDDRLTLLRADTGEQAFDKSAAATRLGDYAFPARTAWTPDGRRLVAVQSDGRLSVWAADCPTAGAAGRPAEAGAARFAFHLRAAADLHADPAGAGFRLHAAALDRLAPPNPHLAATWAGLKQRAGR